MDGDLSYLVESRKDVVSKLNLSNGCGTGNSYTDTKSHNALLTKGSVEDSVLPCGDRRCEVQDERANLKITKSTHQHSLAFVFIEDQQPLKGVSSGYMQDHFTVRCRSFVLHVQRNKPALKPAHCQWPPV